MNRAWFILAIILALTVKIGLFSFIASQHPDSILEFDSQHYLWCASSLADGFRGVDISKSYYVYRTPGYPFFLTVFHHWLGLPLIGVVVVQLMLNVLAAWIVALAARRIDPRLVPMSVLVILWDFPTTVFSLLIMTESVCLVLMSLFFYAMVRVAQESRVRWALLAGLCAGAAALVRPAVYYFPLMISGLMFLWAWIRPRPADGRIFSWSEKFIFVVDAATWKRLICTAVLLVSAYAAILGWQYRNYVCTGTFEFSSIGNATIKMHGLIGRYARGDQSGKVDAQSMNPVVYYVYTTSRHVIDLMTEPGSLKYFDSHVLRKAGNVFGYLVVLFWLPAFLVGLWNMEKNIHFWWAALAIFYFVAVTILAVGWETTPRFRVPMMPFIAVLSAQGWLLISANRTKRKT